MMSLAPSPLCLRSSPGSVDLSQGGLGLMGGYCGGRDHEVKPGGWG